MCPPPSDPAPTRWGPLEMLGQYLLWHAVNVCGARCLLCVDTLDYLRPFGAIPRELAPLLATDNLVTSHA